MAVSYTHLDVYKRQIHPSLLPAFPGKDAIGQALAAGVPRTGVTIHYVDEGMDTGPVSYTHLSLREQGVKLKLSAVRGVVEGRRVALVDDSFVRGTTGRRITRLLRCV